MSLNSNISVFCLGSLSVYESGVVQSPTTTVLGLLFDLTSGSIYFMKLLGATVFVVYRFRVAIFS